MGLLLKMTVTVAQSESSFGALNKSLGVKGSTLHVWLDGFTENMGTLLFLKSDMVVILGFPSRV
jgi:hypothetical protein